MSGDTPPSFDDAAELRRRLRQLGYGPTNPARSDELERSRADRIAASLDGELRHLVRRRARVRLASGVALASAAAVLLALGFRGRWFDRGAIIAQEQLPPVPVSQKTAASPLAVPTATPSAVVSPREPVRRSSSAVAVPGPVPSLSVAPQASGTLGKGDAPEPPPGVERGGPPADPEARSTLGEENRLFQDAAEASRRGDVGGALGLLDKLLTDFPRSPLAQTALVRKFRLLAKAGRTSEAAREAERYLKSYPTGFAVSEARALQGTTPDPSTTSTTDTGSEP